MSKRARILRQGATKRLYEVPSAPAIFSPTEPISDFTWKAQEAAMSTRSELIRADKLKTVINVAIARELKGSCLGDRHRDEFHR